jgi:hypothetical protein
MNQMKFFIISNLMLLFLFGCTEKYPNKIESGDPVLTGSNCEVCHLDKDLLKEVADPLPPPPGGEGSGEG